MENREGLIKNIIMEKYGSINKFVDEHYTELGMSRTHIYALLNYSIKNPGVHTLEKLSKLLDLPKEVVINDYLDRYRDRGSEN